MREVVFELIKGNPYIQGTKPDSSRQIFTICDDTTATEKPSEARRVTTDDLDEARKHLQGVKPKE